MEKLYKNIESNLEKMIELETLLTSVPAMAPESEGQGELKKCEVLEAWLKENGITNLVRYDAPDSRVESGIRPNLVATIEGKSDDYSIWVMAHMEIPDLSARWPWFQPVMNAPSSGIPDPK